MEGKAKGNSLCLGAVKDFKTNLQKGYTGEKLILEHLTKRGYIVYSPAIGQRHPVDMICFNKKNYSDAFIVEIKTKPKMRKYNATGIDCNHFMVYDEMQRVLNLPVFIFFVDFSLRRIYGNYLDELAKTHRQIEEGRIVKYPFVMSIYRSKCVVLFGLDNMIDIASTYE